jgi:hypothetical protein
MKLLTSELLKTFEEIGDQFDAEDPILVTRFRYPYTKRVWYPTEYDPQAKVFYGYVEGDFCER